MRLQGRTGKSCENQALSRSRHSRNAVRPDTKTQVLSLEGERDIQMMPLMLAAVAAATNTVVELAPVIVYASRIDDAKAEMPAMVQVFDAKAIADSGARDLPELLKKQAGVDVYQLNANPMQSEISMRGFGENSFGRVKIILDGEVLNNVDMSAPNLMRMPLANVERIEIIRGPSPVLHGDGAVAGVVNIISDSREYAEKTRLSAKAGSQDTFGASVSTKGGVSEDGLLYSAAYDYLTSDGYRSRSAYDMHSANGSLRQNFENGSTVAIRSNYQDAHYELPGALSYAQLKANRKQASNYHDWARVWNYGLSLDSKMNIADDQWLYVDAGFDQQRRMANWGTYGYQNRYDIFGFFLSPRYVNEMDIGEFDNRFTTGVDLRYDRDNITDNSGFNNHKYHFGRMRYAAFVHNEFHLTETLSFIAGARLERICNRWTNYLGLSDTASNDWEGDFELALVYRPFDGLKTWVKGTRFHRSPFCDEMNYTKSGELLKPERGTSVDIGMEYAVTKELLFDIDGYAMSLDDEIFYNPYSTWTPFGWNGYNCNSPSRTRRVGLDVGLGWRREKTAEAGIRYGIVHADFADGQYHGKDIPRVPNHRVRAEAGVWLCDSLEIKGGCRYVGSQRLVGDFDNSHGKLGDYVLFDIGAYFEAPWAWAEGWKASFIMDNVFDRDYCDFAGWSSYSGAYYYPACGRSFLFTVSYEF